MPKNNLPKIKTDLETLLPEYMFLNNGKILKRTIILDSGNNVLVEYKQTKPDEII